MRKRSELFFNTLLLPIDFLAVMGAFILAYYVRVKLTGRPVANPLGIVLFLKISLLIIPVWIIIFALSGLYNLTSLRGRLEELGKIFVAVSGGTMFLILVDFISRQPLFPAKAVPIYGYGFSFAFVLLGRQIVRLFQRYLFKYDIGVHRVLLVGSGEIAQKILGDLSDTARSGFRIIGAIDSASRAKERLRGIKVFSSLKDADEKIGPKNIDEIIQADSALGPDEILELVSYANNNHLAYRFVPNQFGIYATNSTVSTLAGLPIIEIKQTPLEGWGRIVKRGFDLVGSLLGLIVLSPLFLLTGLIIKLTDPGPVFYKHKRLSRVGKPIYIYKFRTMRYQFSTGSGFSGMSDAEIFKAMGRPDLAEEFSKAQKLKDDPRVSPVGKIMRRTSLDELPQLFNVLKGELSLVGPRPIVDAELERYGEERSRFLALKPGLTGLWQISGRSDLDYDERVKLDIFYVENWSLFLDIKILLKTVVVLLGRRGAY